VSERQTFILAHAEARRRAAEAVSSAPDGWAVSVAPPTRNLAQNSRLWASLSDVARQVIWHGRKLDPESWKCIFSAALKKQDVVPNIDGTGFVVLGQSTSKMTKGEFSELLEIIYAFGAERGVVWSEPVVL
jgi:hypothetical protein